jgi:hypothetical protein
MRRSARQGSTSLSSVFCSAFRCNTRRYAESIYPSSWVAGNNSVLLGALIAASLLVTGFFLFRALRIASLNLPPLNAETIEYFKGNSEKDIHEELSVKMSDAVRHNREAVKRKTDSLKVGY